MLFDSLPTDPSDSYLPGGLFALFALLAALGGFWIVSSHWSRRAGWVVALATLAFFGALFAGLRYLLSTGGAP